MKHVGLTHEKTAYSCDQREYWATNKEEINRHEETRYQCNTVNVKQQRTKSLWSMWEWLTNKFGIHVISVTTRQQIKKRSIDTWGLLMQKLGIHVTTVNIKRQRNRSLQTMWEWIAKEFSIRYSCDQRDYETTKNEEHNRHVRMTHEKKCDYDTQNKEELKS